MSFIIAQIIINALFFAAGYVIRYAQQCEQEELDSIDADELTPCELRGDFETRQALIKSVD
jgi:hypothetical protein